MVDNTQSKRKLTVSIKTIKKLVVIRDQGLCRWNSDVYSQFEALAASSKWQEKFQPALFREEMSLSF